MGTAPSAPIILKAKQGNRRRSLTDVVRRLSTPGTSVPVIATGSSGGTELMELLLSRQYHSIPAELIKEQAGNPVLLELSPHEPQVWVWPLHVLCAMEEHNDSEIERALPLELLQALLDAAPEITMTHTMQKQRKLVQGVSEQDSSCFPTEKDTVASGATYGTSRRRRSDPNFGHSRRHPQPASVMDVTKKSDDTVGISTSVLEVSRGSDQSSGGASSSDDSGNSPSGNGMIPPDCILPWGVGWLPLHVALWYRRSDPEFVNCVLQANPQALLCKNGQGLLPLHLACWSTEAPPSVELVQLLLEGFPAARHVPTSTYSFGDNSTAPIVSTTALSLLEQAWGKREMGLDLWTLMQRGPVSCPNHKARTSSGSEMLFVHNMPLLEPSRRAKKKKMISTNESTALVQALSHREWDRVLKILTLGTPKQSQQVQIWTLTSNPKDPPCHMLPLHLALRRKAPVRIIETLLDRFPAAATTCEYFGMMALHVACRVGAALPICQAVWKACPAAATKKDLAGMMPLHLACSSHALRVDVVLWLLHVSGGIGMTDPDASNQTPLTYVRQQRHPHQSLIEEAFGRGQLYWGAMPAMTVGSLADCLVRGDAELVLERLQSHPEEAKLWWIRGKEQESKRHLPLHIACEVKQLASVEVLQRLVELYPEALSTPCFDEYQTLPLHLAIQYQLSPTVVQFLMDASPSAARVADSTGMLPLHLLACCTTTSTSKGRALMQNLIQLYPEAILMKNEKHLTPLDYAQAANSKQLVATLDAAASSFVSVRRPGSRTSSQASSSSSSNASSIVHVTSS